MSNIAASMIQLFMICSIWREMQVPAVPKMSRFAGRLGSGEHDGKLGVQPQNHAAGSAGRPGATGHATKERMRMMRVLNRRAGLIALIGAALALAGCGSSENTGDRAGGGALVGAGSGAAIGAIFGGVGALPGALIGAGAGAGTSVVTTDKQVNLGTPVWERR
jgi:osmotically inducible lipoprotein OsmB